MKNYKIAWIEDDIDILRPLLKPLIQRGFTIKEYLTYGDAKENIEDISQCDLILLDLIIPPGEVIGLDDEDDLGKKFLAEFRAAYGNSMPIIILSVFGESEADGMNQEERKKYEVHCLAKRIRPSKLLEEVTDILKRREERDQK